MRNVPLSLAIVGVIIAVIAGDIADCDYFDTVDLTDSRKFENGSYQYLDILIPKEKVGLYNYQILFGGEEKPVAEHTRGCACQIKSCVRFCCDPQRMLVEGEAACKDVGHLNYSYALNITMIDGTEREQNVGEFIVQQHLPVPCHDHLLLNAAGNEDHKWTLFENGTLFRHYDEASLSKQDYCLQPTDLPDGQYNYTLVPHHCLPPTDKTNSYIQMVSVISLTLIIVVYPLLPNFKSVHGKCCTCYFACLTLSFILLVIVNFEWVDKTQSGICLLAGYGGYYAVMATFLWLSIINYDLWKTFNNIGVGRKSRFMKYNIFAWSFASVLLVFTCLADFVLSPNISLWKPEVGRYSCWINTYDLSALIYYYGPIFILIICNTTLFIKTSMQIFVQNRKNRRQLRKSECQRNLRNLTNFEMFFRLFIIVGVVWVLEILSYMAQILSINSMWITIADMFTCGQGIILFIVTILKKDVLKSLIDRIRVTKSPADSSITSTSTQQPLTEICLLPICPKASSTGAQ